MLSILVAATLITQTTPAEDPLAEAQAELAAAKQAYIDARRNKSNLEEAALNLGTVTLNSLALKPKEKYPMALALFRQVIALNPDNQLAKEGEDLIVGIYAGMGKEPGDFDLNSIK